MSRTGSHLGPTRNPLDTSPLVTTHATPGRITHPYTDSDGQRNEYDEYEQTDTDQAEARRFKLATLILFVCILSFLLQAELTKYLQTSMGYQKPYFILYISHSFWAIALPIQFLYTAYLSSATPESLTTSHRGRMNYFANLVRNSTSDLYCRKMDYTLVSASPSVRTALGSDVHTSPENRILSRHLFWVTFGMTVLFMIPSYIWYTCIAMTSMANLTAIYNTSCFFAYIFSVLLLRETIVMNKIFAVFLSLLGVVIINLAAKPEGEHKMSDPEEAPRVAVSLISDALALFGAALYGFDEVVYKKYASPKVHPIVFANTLTGLMGVVTCTILWVPIPLFHWTGHEIFELPTLYEFSSILIIAALGLIYNGCFMIVVSQTNPVFAAVGVMATIPLIALTDWFLFGQVIGWDNILGGLSILAGLGILKLAPKLNGANHGTVNTPASNTSQIIGTKTLNPSSIEKAAPFSSTAQQRVGPQSSVGSGLAPSSIGQGLAISRHANPFAKGFSGLRPNNASLSSTSNLSPLKPSSDHKAAATTRTDANTRVSPLRSTNAQTGQGGTSSIRQEGGNRRRPVYSTPVPAVSEGDFSFGGDISFGDELAFADLIDELVEERNEEKNDSPLSWTPAPSKALKLTISTAPSSQQSQSSLLSQSLQPTASSQPISTSITGSTPSKKYEKIPASLGVNQLQSPKRQPSTRLSISTAKTIEVSRSSTTTFANGTEAKTSTTSTISRTSQATIPNTRANTISRPQEQDTVDHRNRNHNSKQPILIEDEQENERHSLLRSYSSPSAGGSSSIGAIRNKRRLPGPAGNLPRLSAEEKEQLFRSRGVPFAKDAHLSVVNGTNTNSSIKKRIEPIRQGPIDRMFANGAWEDMLRAYKLPDYKPSTLRLWKGTAQIIEHSISDIENSKELHRGKVPNLIVMIKEIVFSEIDAAVTLLDPSGEMRGTVHRTVLEQYKDNEVRIGTVLVLQNVSVFSPRTASHYLIITLRNIAAIFQPHPPSIILSQGSSQDKRSPKKRKLGFDSQGSQEGESSRSRPLDNTGPGHPVNRPTEASGTLLISSSSVPDQSTNSGVNRSRQDSYNDWDNVVVKQEWLQEDDKKASKPAPSNQKQKQNQPNSNTLYAQEVNFQSLQQTLGGSSIINVRDRQTHNDHVAAAPMISLGPLTQDDVACTVAPAVGGKSLLSSFAAPANLRKRTSSSSTSQRSNSAVGSDTQSPSQPAAKSSKSPGLSLSPLSAETNRSSLPDLLSSSDWPDDFDFGPTLDADLSSNSVDRFDQGNANQPTSFDPTPSSGQSADFGDDDLDNLLDGLDEAELYDI
ncbi:hypothetical protein BGZ65_002535 [Modicella reniformis]|uniref:Homologous recombination OB-fold protein OB-fold domain-containing protein n=1 Tax=Modicella reniformis TaxID=1440133 RepID=A0A9P6LT90_9FUNG|nr:hypothetical protein BGZ65_002535 [Modicella reniformis]